LKEGFSKPKPHSEYTSVAFIVATILSLAASAYGLYTEDLTLFIPYLFLHPTLLWFVGSLRLFNPINRITTPDWSHALQTWMAWAIMFNIFESVFFAEMGFQYDIFLHFGVSFFLTLVTFLLYPVIRYLITEKVLRRYHSVRAVILIMIIGGIGFEALEAASDTLFQTKLFWDASQSIQVDVAVDLFMDGLGIAVALMYAQKNLDLKKYLLIKK